MAVTLDLSRCPFADFPKEKEDEHVYIVTDAHEYVLVIRSKDDKRFLVAIRNINCKKEILAHLHYYGFTAKQAGFERVLLSEAIEIVKLRRQSGEDLTGLVFLDNPDKPGWFPV